MTASTGRPVVRGTTSPGVTPGRGAPSDSHAPSQPDGRQMLVCVSRFSIHDTTGVPSGVSASAGSFAAAVPRGGPRKRQLPELSQATAAPPLPDAPPPADTPPL